MKILGYYLISHVIINILHIVPSPLTSCDSPLSQANDSSCEVYSRLAKCELQMCSAVCKSIRNKTYQLAAAWFWYSQQLIEMHRRLHVIIFSLNILCGRWSSETVHCSPYVSILWDHCTHIVSVVCQLSHHKAQQWFRKFADLLVQTNWMRDLSE